MPYKDPVKKLAHSRRYNAANRERIRRKQRERRYDLRHEYGSTVEQYKVMVEAQNGKCAICQREEPLCVDHDHISGKIRGLLCRRCNAGLGQFKDSIASIKRAILYLGGAHG